MSRTREDLASLRAIPGVSNVTIINQVPFRNGSSSSSISRVIDQERPTTNASMYTLSENGLATMGINLIAGRDFLPDEYQNFEDVSKGGAKEKGGEGGGTGHATLPCQQTETGCGVTQAKGGCHPRE